MFMKKEMHYNLVQKDHVKVHKNKGFVILLLCNEFVLRSQEMFVL